MCCDCSISHIISKINTFVIFTLLQATPTVPFVPLSAHALSYQSHAER